MTESNRLTIEQPAKLVVRLYADEKLVKETDDQRCWVAILNWILKYPSKYSSTSVNENK